MGSVRNYFLVKEVGRLFENKPLVFSTSNSKVLPKDHLNLDEFELSLLATLDYRSISNNTSSAGVSETGNSFKQFLRKLKSTLPFSLFLGLGGPLFLFAGIWKGSIYLRKNKTAVILSLSEPFIDHIIASVLKKLFPKTTWIADIQNLALEPDIEKVFWKGFQHLVYRKVLRSASVISTVSEGLVPHLKKYNNTVEVVELGISSMYPKKAQVPNEKFTITYCGSLYPQQKLDVLLKVIIELVEAGQLTREEVQFQYAGTNQNIWNKHLEEYDLKTLSNDLGSVSYSKSRDIQAASDLNLLLTWNTPNFKTIIPGKYYDYLSVRKPILMIINGDIDFDWEHRFQYLQPGFMCYNSGSEGLKEYVSNQIKLWRTKADNSLVINQDLLEQHLIKNQVSKLTPYLS